MEIYTIGFTKKSAAEFFNALKSKGIQRLIDVRINNSSQLAGYSKQDDLEFFLKELNDIEYIHEPLLAPTRELLKSYRDKRLSWQEYETRFLELLTSRRIENKLDRNLFKKKTVLLCSEPTSDQCHRRLVVEYLDLHWGNVQAVNL